MGKEEIADKWEYLTTMYTIFEKARNTPGHETAAEDAYLNAVIELVLFAKTHGYEIVEALRG